MFSPAPNLVFARSTKPRTHFYYLSIRLQMLSTMCYILRVYSWTSPRPSIQLITIFYSKRYPTMVFEGGRWSGSGATSVVENGWIYRWFGIDSSTNCLWRPPRFSFRSARFYCIHQWSQKLFWILSNILFADDCNLFCSHKYPETLLNTVNAELNCVFKWIQANKLSLNINKTYSMLFSNSVLSLPDHIKINNVTINQVESTKFLGVYIDSKLIWKVHINCLCKLLSRNSGVMNKLKPFVLPHVMLLLYSTLILPYLNYCILAWGIAL